MIKEFKPIYNLVEHYSPFTQTNDGFNHRKLKIRIPVCTYIICRLCNDLYIKEHVKTCPCLNPNKDD
jgi:hypothetical protein